MANNVFGNPITYETLRGMPEYEITRLDRARVALSMKNVGEKSANARTYVEKLKEEYDSTKPYSTSRISTLCLVYNATGDTIKFHAKNDWHGEIGKSPYPPQILNGQWGAFLHVPNIILAGSNAAVVYRGLNNAGSECDWLLSWSNPWSREAYKNTVYTEVRQAGHFDTTTAWFQIYKALDTVCENIEHKSNGCVSIMATGNDTSPIVEAILTLEHVAEEAKPTTGHAQVSPTDGAIPTSEHA